MPDILLHAMSAKHSGNIALAKQLLSQALIQDPTNEAAWMLMSDVVEDVNLRRNCLERVLAINPNNTAASTALTKLNTAPLAPVIRGERDKPFDNPPKSDRTPPFTPPFTWDDSQEQYLALGDLTFSEEPKEAEEPPLEEVPPTFDWANESDEPDKTIQRIFTAVSSPELASQPLPENDLNLPEEGQGEVQIQSPAAEAEEGEDRWLNELVGADEELLTKPQPVATQDFTVSAEPQLGMEAFTSPEQPVESVTSDYLLWDNPAAKTDRLIILSNKALIYANPQVSDIPHILGLFAEKKMIRDLLGGDARMIKLDTIKRITTNPSTAKISIDFINSQDKPANHQLIFSSPQVRDEVMRAFQIRLGANSTETIHSFKVSDKLVPPLVVLLFLAFLSWSVIAGLPMLTSLPATQLGQLQPIVSILESIVNSVGSVNIVLMLGFCALLTIIWMVSNLRKPTNLVIVEYH